MASVYVLRVARREHVCELCGQRIHVGEPYFVVDHYDVFGFRSRYKVHVGCVDQRIVAKMLSEGVSKIVVDYSIHLPRDYYNYRLSPRKQALLQAVMGGSRGECE